MHQFTDSAARSQRAETPWDDGDESDGRLLRRFIDEQDEPAFAALMKSHGPMVYGVCRRILRNHHDAEEALQATFLILARKATSIYPLRNVGNWLFGVAYRTALKSRTLAARRRVREMDMADLPEPDYVTDQLWEDLEPLLDREVSRLPEKYRTPVILCGLEGRSRKDAAAILGCPEGTLSVRLMRARTILAKRLARHGVVLSVGALLTLLTRKGAAAGVPMSTIATTIEAAGCASSADAVEVGAISSRVATLTETVLHQMTLSALGKAGAAFALLIALAIGLAPHNPPQAAQPHANVSSGRSFSVTWTSPTERNAGQRVAAEEQRIRSEDHGLSGPVDGH